MALKDSTGNTAQMSRLRFQVPGNMCCYGPTCSGKTTWICKLLSNLPEHFQTKNGEAIKRIVYCYNSNFQPAFKILQKKGVEFMEGMPGDVEALFPTSKQPGILILDDLTSAMNKDEQALHTVTVTAHHSNIFLIFTQQCLYPRGRNAVQLRQNFHYKVLFPYPADKQTVKRFLSNNETGEQLKWLYDYYSFCCEGYNRYFIIAAHPEDENRLATYRTNVLVGEQPQRVLVDKQRLKNFKTKTKPFKRLQNAPKSVR